MATAVALLLEEDDEERRKRNGGTLLRGAGLRVRDGLRSLRAGLSKWCGSAESAASSGVAGDVRRGPLRRPDPEPPTRECGAARLGPCETQVSPRRWWKGVHSAASLARGRKPNERPWWKLRRADYRRPSGALLGPVPRT